MEIIIIITGVLIVIYVLFIDPTECRKVRERKEIQYQKEVLDKQLEKKRIEKKRKNYDDEVLELVRTGAFEIIDIREERGDRVILHGFLEDIMKDIPLYTYKIYYKRNMEFPFEIVEEKRTIYIQVKESE